jgi:hypothetical protein
MADATPGDTSNTPSAPAPAAAAAPAAAPTPSPAPVPAVTTAPSQTTPDPASPAPAAADPTPAPAATTADTAPKTDPAPQAAAPVAPAFTVPDDLKLAPTALDKFKGFLASKTPDAEGKITLTAQELVDVYADQARTAQQRWVSELTAQNKTWEAESKARFTPAQLAAAETGVGLLTSQEPAFRELAQSFRNHPAFVNAMRVIGERLSEDTFERGNGAPAPAKKALKDVLYPQAPAH